MSIKNLGPNTNGKFKQNYYVCKNPNKYIGDVRTIIYRSSWEHKFMIWCDIGTTVYRWSNESVVVPYISPVDNKLHNYHVDFYIEIKDSKDNTHRFLVEIKPKSQYHDDNKPKFDAMNHKTKRRSKKKYETFLNETKTYYINKAKFSAAQKYAEQRGMKFKVIDETDLKV